MSKKQFLLVIIWPLLMFNQALSQQKKMTLDDFEAPIGEWFECGEVKLNSVDAKRLTSLRGEGVFVNGKAGRIINLISKENFQDVHLTLEFMVSQGSNSGVYLQGRYEIQIFDSWGKENPVSWDCGGIYARYDGTKTYEGIAPLTNACKAPGEWQHLEIEFNAPRFNANGEKTKHAMFKKVKLNGITVHENAAVTGPTASSLDEIEEPLGPLMLQGDHGPVAYRNIVITKR
ncbi:3-keto-disaccharide hydrolase [Cyclobacterium plantarum]|uniref:3-keto-disaccharide hydrolase n=1 Tax=Cyclobacterium plantarum TaxID=2716263 RepID=UPI003F6F3923